MLPPACHVGINPRGKAEPACHWGVPSRAHRPWQIPTSPSDFRPHLEVQQAFSRPVAKASSCKCRWAVYLPAPRLTWSHPLKFAQCNSLRRRTGVRPWIPALKIQGIFISYLFGSNQRMWIIISSSIHALTIAGVSWSLFQLSQGRSSPRDIEARIRQFLLENVGGSQVKCISCQCQCRCGLSVLVQLQYFNF